MQYSGVDKEGKIVECPGLGVRHISGLRILDNHSVNLISSIVTGVTTPLIALKFWPLHWERTNNMIFDTYNLTQLLILSKN